jgi:hypothetical protein
MKQTCFEKKYLPEAKRHLPEAKRQMPERKRQMPEAKGQMPERKRQISIIHSFVNLYQDKTVALFLSPSKSRQNKTIFFMN